MILLAIGSNLESKFGNRFDNIKKAIYLLKKEKIKVIKISNFYETPSYPNFKDPRFINIIVSIKFNSSPDLLLKKILLIEKKMHRIRTIKNAPRTCDIDIIDFEGKVINKKNIVLPHPKAHKRNFVLIPLFEIYPDWIHPITNKKIHILIKNLSIKLRNEITRSKESVILIQ